LVDVLLGRFVGMQNNLIACVIIVFLCIIASCVVGSVSVLARRVPAAMVNAFLYLTACKFRLFSRRCLEILRWHGRLSGTIIVAVLTTEGFGVFITFANCIEHIKVNHIQSKWGPCYPIVRLPPDVSLSLGLFVGSPIEDWSCTFSSKQQLLEQIVLKSLQMNSTPVSLIVIFITFCYILQLYDPTLIRVQYGWTVYVNWVVAGVFLASTCAWFVLKQVLYVETAKTMI
uniref:G_PROTEIN_RECEP_F3_4 domain-containing protein n=1 Tax=Taenia asiatica TaxID=60517 RepID=A0A0R3VVA6_TAEAS